MAGSGSPAEAYDLDDRARWLPEQHSTRRSDFARDRARLTHSSALRRLAAKTQVLSPTSGLDFARNRLTHSLEVAQVGREIGASLGLNPDVVDTACLAHDIGHPPFGHNGERALNDWARSVGGFEGNAQTLRLLTRLEPKVFGPDGHAYGLNLTRASLDASCKYPWPASRAIPDPSGRGKFGFYDDDEAAFSWLRRDAPDGIRCVEAQVMDLSDDIAYSVHDFEDAVVGGYIDVRSVSSAVGHDALLIGRFAGAATEATRQAFPSASLARFGADVVVPRGVAAEIAVLKGIVAAFVMSKNTRQPIYARQRHMLTTLADDLFALGPDGLEVGFAADWNRAIDDAQRRRVVVDQVASLTDQSAIAWYERTARH